VTLVLPSRVGCQVDRRRETSHPGLAAPLFLEQLALSSALSLDSGARYRCYRAGERRVSRTTILWRAALATSGSGSLDSRFKSPAKPSEATVRCASAAEGTSRRTAGSESPASCSMHQVAPKVGTGRCRHSAAALRHRACRAVTSSHNALVLSSALIFSRVPRSSDSPTFDPRARRRFSMIVHAPSGPRAHDSSRDGPGAEPRTSRAMHAPAACIDSAAQQGSAGGDVLGAWINSRNRSRDTRTSERFGTST